MAEFSFAPYNFIPFPEVKVPKPYSKKEELPRHDENVREFFSGRITFDVKAFSEIAVGGKRVTEGERNVNEFCKDVSGRFVIPGSTMRGFIRNHAEILGFAYPEYITDETFLYRKLAGNCKTARDDYNSELKADIEGGLRLPNGVKAGWIYKQGTSYYIQPVREFGKTGTTFFQIHERDLRQANILTTNHYMYTGLIRKFHLQNPRDLDAELKSYNSELDDKINGNYEPYRGDHVRFDYEEGSIRNIGGKEARFKGMVLNSAWMSGKTHHYLVSAEAAGKPFEVPRDQIAEYNIDYQKNCIQNPKLKEFFIFYALPGTKKEDREKRKLFFYKVDRDGRMIGFGATPYFRIFYKQSVKKGIPMDNQKNGYDYVQGMFGYVYGKDAYKGRIAFSDAVYTGFKTKLSDRAVLLMGPRGTAIQMYLEQKGKTAKTLNTYNTKGFKLRGYKFYWKRAAAKTYVEEKESGNRSRKRAKPIVTHLRTLPAESVFRGEIRFDNLKKDELGLLLLSVRYADKDDQHESFMIGGGKSYGYGHIEIRDVALSLIDQASRYTSVNVEWNDDASKRIPEFKNAYKEKLLKEFKIHLEKEESIEIYKAYAGIKDADAYLETSKTIYMPVSRKKGDSKDIPVYADFHPLKEAKDILNEIGSKNPGSGSLITKSEADSGKAVVTHANREKGAVWIAKYLLSESQRQKIENGGIKVLNCVQEWPNPGLLEENARKYDIVLLPARSSPDIEKQAKAIFSKVYRATKSGKVDDGWKVIKC